MCSTLGWGGCGWGFPTGGCWSGPTGEGNATVPTPKQRAPAKEADVVAGGGDVPGVMQVPAWGAPVGDNVWSWHPAPGGRSKERWAPALLQEEGRILLLRCTGASAGCYEWSSCLERSVWGVLGWS